MLGLISIFSLFFFLLSVVAVLCVMLCNRIKPKLGFRIEAAASIRLRREYVGSFLFP